MSTNTVPQSSRLRGGAFWAFAKLQSLPPLLTLPAVGLAAWLATPYAIKLAEGGNADMSAMADAGETGGTTAAPRSDPVAETPASSSGAASPAGPAGGASLLARPITASTIPSWLPLPVPAPAPAPAPAPQPVSPRTTAQRAVSPAARPPKATARLIEPMPQRGVAEREVARGGFAQRQSAARLTTGRSAAIGNGYVPRSSISGGQQWHTGGSVPRGPFNVQTSFGGGYRSFGAGGFMRGGGFSGFRGGGRR